MPLWVAVVWAGPQIFSTPFRKKMIRDFLLSEFLFELRWFWCNTLYQLFTRLNVWGWLQRKDMKLTYKSYCQCQSIQILSLRLHKVSNVSCLLWLWMTNDGGFLQGKRAKTPWNVASAIISSLWILNLIHQPQTFRMKNCRFKLRFFVLFWGWKFVKPPGILLGCLWGDSRFLLGFCCEVTEDEFPPFWVVCAEGHVECARLLLDAGVNINKAAFFFRAPNGGAQTLTSSDQELLVLWDE